MTYAKSSTRELAAWEADRKLMDRERYIEELERKLRMSHDENSIIIYDNDRVACYDAQEGTEYGYVDFNHFNYVGNNLVTVKMDSGPFLLWRPEELAVIVNESPKHTVYERMYADIAPQEEIETLISKECNEQPLVTCEECPYLHPDNVSSFCCLYYDYEEFLS